MPGLRKSEIAARIRSCLEKAGATAGCRLSGDRLDQLPLECDVRFSDGRERRYRLYFWNISQGGRSRSVDEYRIQTKLPTASRTLEFGAAVTLLLGYYNAAVDPVALARTPAPPEDMEVFVSWDAVAHLRVGASSSCQVPFEVMYAAYLDGRATHDRRVSSGTERIRAFRSENLASFLHSEAGGVTARD